VARRAAVRHTQPVAYPGLAVKAGDKPRRPSEKRPVRRAPLVKHFSGRRISEIEIDAIRTYQTARAKVVGTRTVNLETKLLRQVFKAARVWGTLSDDFKPLREDRRGPGRALEEGQERLLLETARSRPEWDVAFYAKIVAANTTMRGCEIKGLLLQEVNLMDREVFIGKSKTEAGRRRIPLKRCVDMGLRPTA
jgi:integrase